MIIKRSKINSITLKNVSFGDISGLIVLVFLLILVIFSPCEIDANGYKTVFYDTSGKNIMEIEFGFYFAMQFAKFLGIKYWGFRACIITLSFLIINNSIRRLNVDTFKFWCLFAIFPMLYISITIRFLFAMSFMILGLSFLLTEQNNVKARIIYTICIIIGTIFHSSILLLLLLLVPHIFDDRKFKKIMIISIVVEIVALLSFQRVAKFITSFITFFRSLVTYYTIKLSYMDWVQFMGVYFLLGVIVYLVIKHEKISDNQENEKTLLVKKNIIIVYFLLVGLVILNSTFSRYFQTAIVVLTIFITNKSIPSRKNILIMKIFYLVIIMFLAYFFLRGRIWLAWNDAFMKISSFEELFNVY